LKFVFQQTAAPAVTRSSSLSLAFLVYSQGSSGAECPVSLTLACFLCLLLSEKLTGVGQALSHNKMYVPCLISRQWKEACGLVLLKNKHQLSLGKQRAL